MNHRAPVLTASLPTLAEPSSAPASSEGLAKPKVMRRPAQFSKPAMRSEPAFMADTRIEAGTPPTPTATAHGPLIRPWQDDPRFAFALLAIVIIVNLALSMWLAPKPTTPTAELAHHAVPLAPTTDPLLEPTTTAPESLIHQLNEAGASVSEQ